MTRVTYTDDEVVTKDRLDKLFWIEIAKRKERKVSGDSYRALVSLHAEMGEFFDDSSAGLDEPIEGAVGAEILMDAFQFDRSPAERADDDAQVNLFQTAMERFREKIEIAAEDLHYIKGFRLADFAVETDIKELWGWWVYINSSRGRQEIGATEGKFSAHGKKLLPDDKDPEKLIQHYIFYSCPTRLPIPVCYAPVYKFSTDVDSIVVNGCEVTESVVVVFGFNDPLPSGREIANAAVAAARMVHARRLHAAMQRGDFSEIERLLGRQIPELRITDYYSHPDEQLLFKSQNSVAPILRGLYAWDLIHGSGCTAAEAYRTTAKELNTTEKNVENALLVVGEKIDAYEVDALPWVR